MADPIIGIEATVIAAKAGGVDCSILWGYLDPNPDGNGQLHLYLSTDFNEYLLINNADKVADFPLYDVSNPLGGSLVWVKSIAPVTRVREETAEQEGAFLKGAIQRGFLSQFHATAMLGLGQLANNAVDPTSGGGCGTGSSLSGCTGPGR